jgi:hypothetical protein
MPYTKIKHGPKGTTLTRVEDRANEDSVESTLTSHELPRPEFITALNALSAWVVRCCELPIDYADGMTVVGVTLSLGEYGGCVVTALRKVSGASSPVVINTPHVPSEPTSDGGHSLPASVQTLLTELEAEADRFWNGQRAQATLFDDIQSDLERHRKLEPAVMDAIDRLRPKRTGGAA